MADFKKDFANHINVIGTNPYLFIGSGLSRRYLNMPTWLNLLKDFSEKLLLQKGFGYYDSKSEGNLPELASLMASEFHETWWTNPAFSDSRKEYENKRIGSQEIPFKIELSKFVSNHKDFQEDYSEEIELLKKVVIDGIITTNWDTFLEATFSDYKTYIGQEQLLFSENISIGEIYKIHGCVTSPESLIVSSNDYANFKKRNAYLAAKLLTIFVEHPVIFLGYSISDPNILELLFSLKDCLAAHNIEKLKDRLIFVEWRAEQNEPIMIDGTLSLSDGKILPIKHIKINSFIPLFDVLANLKQRLPIKILRRFKDVSELKNQLQSTGLNYRLLSNYLSDQEMIWLRKGTDLFIHMQQTDAYSSSLHEYLYSKTKVINAAWLSYKELETWGVPYKPSTFDTLPNDIIEIINTKRDEVSDQLIKFLIVYSWSYQINEWNKTFEKLIMQ